MGSKQKFAKSYILIKGESLRIIIFDSRNAHSNPLFHRNELVKLHDKTIIENCLFISKSVKFDLPSILNNRLFRLS